MHIMRGQLSLEEHTRNHHVVRPAVGFGKADALKAENWLHVAAQFRVADRVAILPEDLSWYGEYLVMKADDSGVYLAELFYRDMGASVDVEGEDNVPRGYQVTWGGKQKWRVQRTVDGHVLAHGLQKLEAVAWAQNDAKLVKAA